MVPVYYFIVSIIGCKSEHGQRGKGGKGIVFKQKLNSIRYLQGLALAVCICLIGCAAPNAAPPASSHLPVTGGGGTFQVHEYALVEESQDNPNHAEFQQRVPAALESHPNGWPFSNTGEILQTANRALTPFGYSLGRNPTPPFSGYALYHAGKLIQRDIARFSPVAVKSDEGKPGGTNFTFSFETMDGEKLVADAAGVHTANVEDQSAGSRGNNYENLNLAFIGGAGNGINLFDSAGQEKGHSDLPDQHGLGLESGNPGSFGTQWIDDQPFTFYSRNDLIHLNYAGRDLPYTYDQVVHDNNGNLSIFNPGGNGRIVWFYALRDGLWYYVEAGVFE
jgi:hypothetical protein